MTTLPGSPQTPLHLELTLNLSVLWFLSDTEILNGQEVQLSSSDWTVASELYLSSNNNMSLYIDRPFLLWPHQMDQIWFFVAKEVDKEFVTESRKTNLYRCPGKRKSWSVRKEFRYRVKLHGWSSLGAFSIWALVRYPVFCFFFFATIFSPFFFSSCSSVARHRAR